jgi:hypothetical protein
LKDLFLNIISLYTEALVPSFHKPLKTSSIKFFGLLSEPGSDFPFHRYHNGHNILARNVTGDVSWVHLYQPETKHVSMQWKHPASPAIKVSLVGSQRHTAHRIPASRTSSGNFARPFNGSNQDSPDQGSHCLIPIAARRILCCWFSGACETMGRVPQYTGRLCEK